MNQKMYAIFTALVLAMSGVLCGCDTNKPEESNAEKSSQIDSAEKEESSANETSLLDQIYTDYLSQQRLCTISKNFQILEPGAAKDNPNGLADAVKYDFDGDKIDELVTFTFERNDQNGEDIRVDLLKVNDGKLEVADSKYLTEMLEINDAESSSAEFETVSNSIYFRNIVSMQLVTSEYQDNLYFGFVMSNENNIYEPNPPREYMKSMSVFTVEEDAITPCMISGTYQNYSTRGSEADQGVLYATLLPPSIRETTTDLGECYMKEDEFADYPSADYIREMSAEIIAEIEKEIRDKGYYTLFANVYSTIELDYCIGGGLYESATSAYSALLNEFGLDLEYNGYNEENDFECTAKFVSRNQSQIKTILEIDAVRGYTEGYESNSYDNSFIASQLTLDSDLEELLGEETPFTEPLTDELALYEDILRHPHYYHEVWDELTKDNYSAYYFIADIDQDGKKELIIKGTSDDIDFNVTVVRDDLTVYNMYCTGSLNIYDTGEICVQDTNSHETAYYLNANNGEEWCTYVTNGERYIEKIGDDTTYTAEESKEIESKLCSGAKLVPEYNYYDVYHPENFAELVDIENVSEITYTWKNAYLELMEYRDNASQYALVYLDEDDIPEFYAYDTYYGLKIYTYVNGNAVPLVEFGGRGVFEGYVEKGNCFCISVTYSDGGYTIGETYYYAIQDGEVEELDVLVDKSNLDEGCTLNEQPISKDEYDKKIQEYSSQFTEVTYVSYDEITKQINNYLKGDSEQISNDTAENTWQKAYVSEIDNFVKDLDINNTDCKYSLIYIDDDEIPEMYILDTKYERSKIYTYFNEKCSMISESGSMRANSLNGYIEKSGKFITYDSGGVYYWGYVVNQLSNGNISESEQLFYEDGVYYCNDDEISEGDYNKKLESYTSQYTEITYFTYNEITEQLNKAE